MLNSLLSLSVNLPEDGFFDRARERIDALNWPQTEASPDLVTVVFGAGPVSGILARHAAQLVAQGTMKGDIFFVGGGPTSKTMLAKRLVKIQSREGISAPLENEDEATYMLRVFHEQCERFNVAPNAIRATAEPMKERDGIERRSQNTQENIGFIAPYLPPTKKLTLIVIPFHAPRAIGTVRKYYDDCGEDMALRAEMAWPEELGISKDTWANNKFALTSVFLESRKYGVCEENSMYVRKGFCAWIDADREKQKWLASCE